MKLGQGWEQKKSGNSLKWFSTPNPGDFRLKLISVENRLLVSDDEEYHVELNLKKDKFLFEFGSGFLDPCDIVLRDW